MSQGSKMLSSVAYTLKFWRLPWLDRLQLIEAAFWLTTARLAISLLTFRRLGKLASMSTYGPEPLQQKRLTDLYRIRWALLACSRVAPWRAKCFEQGLAAQFMLRRRGIPSVLYYGAAPDDQRGLSAHVWVSDGDINVVGSEVASRYAVLAAFPPQVNSKAQNYVPQ